MSDWTIQEYKGKGQITEILEMKEDLAKFKVFESETVYTQTVKSIMINRNYPRAFKAYQKKMEDNKMQEENTEINTIKKRLTLLEFYPSNQEYQTKIKELFPKAEIIMQKKGGGGFAIINEENISAVLEGKKKLETSGLCINFPVYGQHRYVVLDDAKEDERSEKQKEMVIEEEEVEEEPDEDDFNSEIDVDLERNINEYLCNCVGRHRGNREKESDDEQSEEENTNGCKDKMEIIPYHIAVKYQNEKVENTYLLFEMMNRYNIIFNKMNDLHFNFQ